MAGNIETDNPGTIRRRRWAVPSLGNNRYHVFFCYASENSRDVRKIIDNLEVHGIVCGYHERDFEAGSRILDNVNSAIDSAENVVFILSEHFNRSDYCKYEIDQAVLKNVTGKTNIIPVKIEPCAVPHAIRHLTYIDAENIDIDSIHSRIYDAIFKKDLRKQNEKGSNGLVYPVIYKKSKKQRCFARYHLDIDQETRADLQQGEYTIPDDVLDKVARIVNRSLCVRYKHVFDRFKTILFLVFVMILLFFIAVSVLVITLASTKTAVEDDNAPVYVISIGSTGLMLMFTVCACVDWCDRSPCCGGSRKVLAESVRNVNRVLWDRINRHTYNTINVMFFVRDDALNVLHVNITPCKEYFMRHERLREIFGTGDGAEAELEQHTDSVFNSCLRDHGTQLLIPRYNHTRKHAMANYALCACQILEENNMFTVDVRKSLELS